MTISKSDILAFLQFQDHTATLCIKIKLYKKEVDFSLKISMPRHVANVSIISLLNCSYLSYLQSNTKTLPLLNKYKTSKKKKAYLEFWLFFKIGAFCWLISYFVSPSSLRNWSKTKNGMVFWIIGLSGLII